MPAAIFGLGPTEIIIILVIVLLLFGGSKIPELMRGLGQGMREFKKGASDLDDDEKPKLEANTDKK